MSYSQLKISNRFCSDFSFLMQLYRMKCLKFLRTRKYRLKQECLLHASWIVLLEWSLHTLFWALATIPVRFSAVCCWTNITNISTKWSSQIKKENYDILKKNIILILLQGGFKEHLEKLVKLTLHQQELLQKRPSLGTFCAHLAIQGLNSNNRDTQFSVIAIC